MKLILCRKCQDVYKLAMKPRTCQCGLTGGWYLEDGLNAKIWGSSAIAIGLANNSLVQAIINQPESGWGKNFEAFVIPKVCDTVETIEPPKKKVSRKKVKK